MSLPWYRIGPNPATPPLPVTELFYLAYRDTNGRDQAAFSYDTSAKVFGEILDTPVTLDQDSSATRFFIDGNKVLTIENGDFQASEFSEFELPSGVAALLFYRKATSVPDLLAAVSADGTLYTKRLVETGMIPSSSNQFLFINGGNIVASIGASGVFAMSLVEGGQQLITSDGDALIFSDGSTWGL